MSEAQSSAITVRRLRAGDEAEVFGAAALFDGPPHAEAVRAYLANPDNYLLIADVGGQPAGMARGAALQCLDRPDRQMFLYETARRRHSAAREWRAASSRS